jgi:hypothetical protein
MSAPVGVLAVLDADIASWRCVLAMPAAAISDPANTLESLVRVRAAVAELVTLANRAVAMPTLGNLGRLGDALDKFGGAA